MNTLRSLAAACAALALCACGGGGGPSAQNLTLTPSSLAVTLYQGDTREIGQYFTAPGLGPIYAYPAVTDPSSALLPPPQIYRENDDTFLAFLRFSPTLPPGTHTGTLKFTVCSDANCNDRRWQSTLAYTVTILTHTNLTTLSPVAGATDWSTHQGSVTHGGYVPITVNPANFSARWRWAVPGFNANAAYPPPEVAVAEDRVYVGYGTTLYAVSEGTGSTTWTASLGPFHGSQPSYADGAVHTVTLHNSNPPVLRAFEADTGAVRYAKDFPQPANIIFGADRVAIEGDLLVCGTNSGYGLFAFRTSDGVSLWQQNQDTNQLTHTIQAGQVYYYGYTNAGIVGVHALDGSTGTVTGSITGGTTGVGRSPPAIEGADAIVDTYDYILSYALDTSTVNWSVAGSGREPHPDTAPAVTPDVVYVARHGTPLTLVALDRADGAVLWSWSPGPFEPVRGPVGVTGADSGFTSNVVATDSTVFVSTERAVYAISTATHQTVWAYPYPGRLALSANGILYVARSTLYKTHPLERLSDGYIAAINLH